MIGVILSKDKGCLGIPEAGRGKEESSPWDLEGSRSPANTLTAIPQNCKRIHFHCFQPVSWDYFVTAALRNLFRFFQKKSNSEADKWESGQVDKQHTHLCLPLSDLSCLHQQPRLSDHWARYGALQVLHGAHQPIRAFRQDNSPGDSWDGVRSMDKVRLIL